MRVIAAGIMALLGAQDAPLKIRLDVQHWGAGAVPPKGIRKLTADEGRAFEKELKGLAGCREATVADSAVTITLGEADLRLYDIRQALKRSVKAEDGARNVIVFDTLKVAGRVTLALNVEKNQDKVPAAIKGVSGVQEAAASGEGYECKISSGGVPVLSIVKAVAKATGSDYKIFDILKDVTWHAAPAK